MIESVSLVNVLGHLMFHKALIDEGRGAEKIDRYLGLLRSAEGEKQIAGREPLDRSLQLVFELVLSNDLDPWDVDLMKFAKLYGQRMHTEEVDFIVAGKLMHMAWSICTAVPGGALLNERGRSVLRERDTDSSTSSWSIHSGD
jgi:segregation and condensation protein A